MRTLPELVLRWTAVGAGTLTLAAVVLVLTETPAAGWPGLGLMYATGVSYGLAEMTRLFERHRRRCRECLEGTGPHLRWWIIRLALVLVVSVIPVLFLLPVLVGSTP